MIPDHWIQERDQLAAVRWQQAQKGYEPGPDETIVTDEHFEAWAAQTVTASDLAELEKGQARGRYKLGDTRGFVDEQELTCERYNCWMVRADDDGAVSYLSEPVA